MAKVIGKSKKERNSYFMEKNKEVGKGCLNEIPLDKNEFREMAVSRGLSCC